MGLCVPGPRALAVGVVGAGAPSKVGVWFGSGEVDYLRGAPPSPLSVFSSLSSSFSPLTI